jgi:tetratricopeptide (TPR) repeat protein
MNAVNFSHDSSSTTTGAWMRHPSSVNFEKEASTSNMAPQGDLFSVEKNKKKKEIERVRMILQNSDKNGSTTIGLASERKKLMGSLLFERAMEKKDKKRYHKTLKYLQESKLFHESPSAVALQIIEVARLLGDTELTRKQLKELEGLDLDNQILYRCSYLRQLLGDTQEAMADLTKAFSNDRTDFRSILKRAEIKFTLGNFYDCLLDLNIVETISPNNVTTASFRGASKTLLGFDLESALFDLEFANKENPNDCFVLTHLGEIKRLLRKDLDIALEHLNKADSLQPKDDFILSRRADVKRLLRDFEGSLSDINDLSFLDPFSFTVRGIVKQSLGDIQDSLNDFKAALELATDTFTITKIVEVEILLGLFSEAEANLTTLESCSSHSQILSNLKLQQSLHRGRGNWEESAKISESMAVKIKQETNKDILESTRKELNKSVSVLLSNL